MDSPTIWDCSLETAARTWNNAMAIELHDDGRPLAHRGGSPRGGDGVREVARGPGRRCGAGGGGTRAAAASNWRLGRRRSLKKML